MKQISSKSKLCLVLFFSILVGFSFNSCKKECTCNVGGEFVDDDGGWGTVITARLPFGKLSNSDCMNLEGSKTERDEEKGTTYYLMYSECQLQ